MQELLLDTIAFDFLLRNPLKLPVKSRQAIEQADTVYVSVVSLWELSNHIWDGKFSVSIPFKTCFERALQVHQLTLLPLRWEALAFMSQFAYQTIGQPFRKMVAGEVIMGEKITEHKDTFDRMLITHAITGNCGIVSPDALSPSYEPLALGLTVIWK